MTGPLTIAMRRCRNCGEIDVPTRTVCAACLGDGFDRVDVEARGTLVSWTTIRRAPTQFRDDVPYDVCVVDLADGQRVTGRLAAAFHSASGADDDDVAQGPAVGAAVVATDMRGDTPIFSSSSRGTP